MSTPLLLRRGIVSGAILITGCLLLASCSSGSGASSASLSAPGPTTRGLPANASASGGFGGATVPGSAGTSAERQARQTTALIPVSQSIIYTASLTLRSADVAAATQRAVSIARAAGGYVAGEHETSASPGGRNQTVSLTLKIPAAGYQDALAQLSAAALGKRLSLQEQATDVTEQVANVNSLVTSQLDAIAALQGLLKKASSVSGLLQVQQQISADESNLNALQAQQRALDHETTYATVTMRLLSPKQPPAHKKTARHGFAAGLAAGWKALRHATAWTLTAFGAALPFLIILALLAAGGYAGWRRFGRNRTRPASTA